MGTKYCNNRFGNLGQRNPFHTKAKRQTFSNSARKEFSKKEKAKKKEKEKALFLNFTGFTWAGSRYSKTLYSLAVFSRFPWFWLVYSKTYKSLLCWHTYKIPAGVEFSRVSSIALNSSCVHPTIQVIS